MTDPSTDSSLDYGSIHFERKRQLWTLNHHPYDPNSNVAIDYKSHPKTQHIQQHQFDQIYALLASEKSFKNPLPLSFVMGVVIDSWKKQGLWNPPT